MTSPPAARLRAAVATIAVVALAAPAAPALASGFTLDLSSPKPAVVGQPLVLQATGTIPVQDLEFPYWFSLSAIPATVQSTCPEDHFEAKQIATATGGAIVTMAQRESPDASGSFSIPVAVTPSSPGSVLLCGYTDDGATNTLAGASLTLDIQAAQSGSGSGSRSLSPAQEALGGIRSCQALLDHPKSCMKRAVARAKSRCRKLHSHKKRASCVRAVNRAARKA